MSKRNTRQKDIIFNVISNDYSHPTISDIYYNAKKIDSTIGQATIYRNVNELVAEGKVNKLLGMDNTHYDFNTSDHNHFVCTNCHKIIDVFDKNYNINSIDNPDILVNKVTIIYEGLCKECSGISKKGM